MSDFTPEQVERAAKVFVRFPRGVRMYWDPLSDLSIEERRKLARAVLSAAGAPEELEHLRAGIKHVSGRMAEARATLQGYADRIDEHVFGELASELDDQWCDFETGMPLGAPEKVAPVVDEAKLADVLWNHFFTLTGRCECGYQAPSMNPRHATDHLASVVAAYLRGESK